MWNADLLALLMLILGYFPTAIAIHRYLHRYVPVEYNRHELHRRHVYYDDQLHLEFQFKAAERLYDLRLRRSTASLTSNFTLYHEGKAVQPDRSHIYQGYVKDVPGSRVYGAIMDGTFQGSIKLPGDGTFHVETNRDKSSPFHSIMYSHEDIKWDDIGHFCGQPSPYVPNSSVNKKNTDFTKEMVQAHPHIDRSPHWSRATRSTTQTDENKDLLKKHICTLRLTADHRMWDFIYRKNDKNSGRALNEILFLVESHVAELNDIFGNTVFTTKIGNQQLTYRGIQFEIRKVQIIKPEDCEEKDGPLSKAGVCKDGLSSDILLQQYSKMFQDEDPFYDYTKFQISKNGLIYFYGKLDYYDDYYGPDFGESTSKERICLNYLFTARVLFASNGNAILGQAYNAQIDRSGGVCFTRDNVGMITILQNTETHELPHMITMNVFAHEVGHSFGAKHDDGKECVSYFPSKEEPDDGFYLMYSVASATRKTNNRIFSNCSIDFVARILNDDYYTECFEDSNVPFCGNNVVEEGEACDCGTNETCQDICCYGKGEIEDRPDLDCQLKTNATCSPTQGPCCDGSTCKYIDKKSHFVCANVEPCVDERHCDNGAKWKAECPPPMPSQVREDGFVCNKNGRVCEHGQCNASICKLIGWRECQNFNDNEKLTIDEREELCYIGCQRSSKSECISTHNSADVQAHFELVQLLANFSEEKGKYSVRLPMGTPCNKMTGYCDVFYRCRGVNPDTPLVRLKNCVISGECAQELANFLKVYWPGVSVIIIIALFCFIVFLYCCTVHTKSSNPVLERLRPHRSIRDDIRTVSSIRRSIRQRVSTIRRSMKSSSRSLEAGDPASKGTAATSKYFKTDMKTETEPLQSVKETDVEVDIHDGKSSTAETHKLHEIEPLNGQAEDSVESDKVDDSTGYEKTEDSNDR